MAKNKIPRASRSISERLFSRTIPDAHSGCLLWTGSKTRGGYGMIKYRGDQNMAAHRVAWTETYGQIPAGYHVLHRCDVPLCVNPRHLFLGTHLDNMRDMIAKKRTVVNRGSRNGNSSLTESDVVQILSDTRPQRIIAAFYGVTQYAIFAIKNNKTWKHIER